MVRREFNKLLAAAVAGLVAGLARRLQLVEEERLEHQQGQLDRDAFEHHHHDGEACVQGSERLQRSGWMQDR